MATCFGSREDRRGRKPAVRILPPTVNGPAQLISTGNLSRSVDRISEAISPVAWDDNRVGHSLDVREGRGKHRVGGIVADKVACLIQAVDDRLIRALHIEFREDAAIQEIAVSKIIAPDIPAANQPLLGDAPPLGETGGIVRLDNRGTEAGVCESHKTARYTARVDIKARYVAPIINSRWDRLGHVAAGIIKSRDDLD